MDFAIAFLGYALYDVLELELVGNVGKDSVEVYQTRTSDGPAEFHFYRVLAFRLSQNTDFSEELSCN